MNLVGYSDDESDSGSHSPSSKPIESKKPVCEQSTSDSAEKSVPPLKRKLKLLGAASALTQVKEGQNKGRDWDFTTKKICVRTEQENSEEIQDAKNAKLTQKNENYEIVDLQRTRRVPHMDGQFACYIYIDVTRGLQALVNAQQAFKQRAGRDYPTCNFTDIEPDNFHISLSKTFYLNKHQIDPFIESLQGKYLKNFQHMSLNIDLNRLRVFSNEDFNRFFISAGVGSGKNIVREIVDKIDNCLQAYGLDTFFKGNKHHISLLWTTNRQCQTPEFKLYIKDNRFNSSAIDGLVTLDVSQIQLKIGNRITNITLNKS